MAEKVERMWCEECGDFRRCTSPRTNHFLHLFIVLMLIGSSYLIRPPLSNLPEMLAFIWVIAWVVMSLKENWRCGECGARVRLRGAPKPIEQSVAHKVGKAISKRPAPTVIPPKPSVLHETARAEWEAKYGKKG